MPKKQITVRFPPGEYRSVQSIAKKSTFQGLPMTVSKVILVLLMNNKARSRDYTKGYTVFRSKSPRHSGRATEKIDLYITEELHDYLKKLVKNAKFYQSGEKANTNDVVRGLFVNHYLQCKTARLWHQTENPQQIRANRRYKQRKARR